MPAQSIEERPLHESPAVAPPEEFAAATMSLCPCSICGRKLKADRLPKHEAACAKASQKRKTFNVKEQRMTEEQKKSSPAEFGERKTLSKEIGSLLGRFIKLRFPPVDAWTKDWLAIETKALEDNPQMDWKAFIICKRLDFNSKILVPSTAIVDGEPELKLKELEEVEEMWLTEP